MRGSELTAIAGQALRFGASGVLLTILVAGGYWLLATPVGLDPMLSMTLAFLAVTGIGYLLHSRFSFRGHGGRDNTATRTARFFTVNVLGFLSNQFFVWLLVKQMGGPTWWPILPVLFVTPVLTFTLNRKWVFG